MGLGGEASIVHEIVTKEMGADSAIATTHKTHTSYTHEAAHILP